MKMKRWVALAAAVLAALGVIWLTYAVIQVIGDRKEGSQEWIV